MSADGAARRPYLPVRHTKPFPITHEEFFLSLIAKFVSCSRQIPYMSESAGEVNIAAQFSRIAFANENSAVARHRTSTCVLENFPRRAVVISHIIDGIE